MFSLAALGLHPFQQPHKYPTLRSAIHGPPRQVSVGTRRYQTGGTTNSPEIEMYRHPAVSTNPTVWSHRSATHCHHSRPRAWISAPNQPSLASTCHSTTKFPCSGADGLQEPRDIRVLPAALDIVPAVVLRSSQSPPVSTSHIRLSVAQFTDIHAKSWSVA
ncbi:hypothetical protein C8Q80DRAFT_209889 [Daedaleopsis nitida]|nr:hypothetical protein C8Q80DRAFT_209889 [Daedaleopsis nitida]